MHRQIEEYEMSEDATFNKLKDFLESKPASIDALKHLKQHKEISLVIGGTLHCAVLQSGGQPQVERRKANDPDVEFRMKPESVDVLAASPGDDVGELGVLVIKEIIAGQIQIKVPGSFFNIMRNGYIDIIRQGGSRFMGFLAQHGLSSITKITSTIKKLKKS